MKRYIAYILALSALTAVFGLTACSGRAGSSKATPPPTSDRASQLPQTTHDSGFLHETLDTRSEPSALGKLEHIEPLPDFSINGLRLDGDRSEEGNGREFSMTDIRYEFKLGEHISFYMDTDYADAESGRVKIVCTPYHSDVNYYFRLARGELESIAVFEESLVVPGEDGFMFATCIPEESCRPGFYDVLFTFRGEVVYRLVLNVTADAE